MAPRGRIRAWTPNQQLKPHEVSAEIDNVLNAVNDLDTALTAALAAIEALTAEVNILKGEG